MDVEQIFQSIRDLPVRDRLRLVERVVRELADTSPAQAEPASTEPSPLGRFAEGRPQLGPGARVPGWSLDPEFKAAEKLLEFLRAEERAAG